MSFLKIEKKVVILAGFNTKQHDCLLIFYFIVGYQVNPSMHVHNYFLIILEVECRDPMSPKNGYIEVSNFKGTILTVSGLEMYTFFI